MSGEWSFVVDSREKKRIRELCNLCNIPFTVDALKYGDFALRIEEQNPDNPKLTISHDIVGVERKRAEDYISSVLNQRIFHQMNGLPEIYEIPILAISGSRIAAMADITSGAARQGKKISINENVLDGAMASIFVRRVPYVIWFENDIQMIKIMHSIFEKIYEDKWQLAFSTKPKRRNAPDDALMLVPGVTRPIAKKLLKKYGNIANISVQDIKELNTVTGKVVAHNIKLFFGGTYEVKKTKTA